MKLLQAIDFVRQYSDGGSSADPYFFLEREINSVRCNPGNYFWFRNGELVTMGHREPETATFELEQLESDLWAVEYKNKIIREIHSLKFQPLLTATVDPQLRYNISWMDLPQKSMQADLLNLMNAQLSNARYSGMVDQLVRVVEYNVEKRL